MKSPVSPLLINTESSTPQCFLLILLLQLLRNPRLRSIIQPHHLQRFLHGPTISSLVGPIGLQMGAIGLLSMIAPGAQAQSAITSISTTYSTQLNADYLTKTANPCDNATTKVFLCDAPAKLVFGSGTNNENNLQLDSVTAGGTTYSYRGLADRIKIRRLSNSQVTADRQIIFFQNNSASNASGGNPILFNVSPSRVDTMEEALLSRTVNRGADNVFANNAPSGNKSKNFNNIERIDYIIQNGIAASTIAEAADIGFVIMDRGGNDRYAIAPILSLDAAGDPATVGNVQVFNINTTIPNTAQNYVVLRREDTSNTSLLRPSDRSGSQAIGGHFISLSKLFLSPSYVPGTRIYGYVLMDLDAPPTPTDVVNLNGFPLNSHVSTTTGGLDLVAGGGIFSKDPLYTLSGTVFNDVDGTALKDSSEPFINGTTLGLNAILVDSNNKAIATTTVSSTGTYSFSNIAAGAYTVLITTNTPVGTTPPAIALPTNWVTTGENQNGTVETAPATPDSKIAVTITTANITNVNFGIEQRPTAKTSPLPSQSNPGGTTSASVPMSAFNTSTDPDTGTVDRYRMTTFPTNATSIEIDGTIYTLAGGNGTTAFPTATGVTVLATKLNTLKVDPIDGSVNVTIPFKAIDNAGQESTNTSEAIVPFTTSVVTSPPELILLKRITKINGQTIGKNIDGTPIDLTRVVAQPDNPVTPRNESSDATNPNWTTNYPKGAIDAGVVKSGDLVEYTIYFLSIGGKPVTNANFCDWVPKNTSFVPDAYGLGKGIQLAIGPILNTLTNVPDGDRGVFYNPGAIPPATYPNGATYKLNCMTPVGVDGAVVVNLVNNTLAAPENQLSNATAAGTPGNSYGLVRFVSKVK